MVSQSDVVGALETAELVLVSIGALEYVLLFGWLLFGKKFRQVVQVLVLLWVSFMQIKKLTNLISLVDQKLQYPARNVTESANPVTYVLQGACDLRIYCFIGIMATFATLLFQFSVAISRPVEFLGKQKTKKYIIKCLAVPFFYAVACLILRRSLQAVFSAPNFSMVYYDTLTCRARGSPVENIILLLMYVPPIVTCIVCAFRIFKQRATVRAFDMNSAERVRTQNMALFKRLMPFVAVIVLILVLNIFFFSTSREPVVVIVARLINAVLYMAMPFLNVPDVINLLAKLKQRIAPSNDATDLSPGNNNNSNNNGNNDNNNSEGRPRRQESEIQIIAE